MTVKLWMTEPPATRFGERRNQIYRAVPKIGCDNGQTIVSPCVLFQMLAQQSGCLGRVQRGFAETLNGSGSDGGCLSIRMIRNDHDGDFRGDIVRLECRQRFHAFAAIGVVQAIDQNQSGLQVFGHRDCLFMRMGSLDIHVEVLR